MLNGGELAQPGLSDELQPLAACVSVETLPKTRSEGGW
jgi:hypothetical protein